MKAKLMKSIDSVDLEYFPLYHNETCTIKNTNTLGVIFESYDFH